jgi:hypothetical protein
MKKTTLIWFALMALTSFLSAAPGVSILNYRPADLSLSPSNLLSSNIFGAGGTVIYKGENGVLTISNSVSGGGGGGPGAGTQMVASAIGNLMVTNVESLIYTNLDTNAVVTFDLAGPAIGHYGIYGNSTIYLTNVAAFTNSAGSRSVTLKIRQVGIAGTLTIAPVGPHSIDWDEGAPFIATGATNTFTIAWDGLQFVGFSSHAGSDGSGTRVYSNAPSLFDPRFTGKNSTSNYVWTCTNSTTGEGEWRTTTKLTNYSALQITNGIRFAESNVIVSSTANILLDLSQSTLFKIYLLTNGTFIFTNQGAGLQRAQCWIQQDTNGQRTTSWSVAGGLLQTNANLQATTNANGLDLLELSSGFFSTNLTAWWPQNFQARVGFTNSLEQPFLINQGFEGAGYDHASTESWTGNFGNGTEDPDFATPFGNGSHCLKTINGNVVLGYWLGGSTNKSEIFGYCKFIVQKTNADNAFIAGYTNNAEGAFVRIDATAKVTIFDILATGATTAGAVATNTVTHLWWHWNTANGTGDVGFSTNGIRPTGGANYASYTGGATSGATALQNAVGFQVAGATITNFFDHVLISTFQIGDNP